MVGFAQNFPTKFRTAANFADWVVIGALPLVMDRPNDSNLRAPDSDMRGYRLVSGQETLPVYAAVPYPGIHIESATHTRAW